MSYPKVAVVILNWNGVSWLEKFLPMLMENTTYSNAEIWVADNASTDNSVSYVRTNFPQVKIHINKENFGFAGGYNMALKDICADYYVLLNSDVEVTKNWIAPVIELMESDKTIAACQPKILSYYQKDTFEYAGAAGGMIDILGYPFCRGRIFDTCEKDEGQYNEVSEIFWSSGACLFIRAGVFHKSEGLDEDFFAHMEEIDLCWRLKNMGYKIMYCPHSSVYHVGGGTLQSGSPRKTYLNFLNNRMMLIKNLPFKSSLKVFLVRDVMDILAIVQGIASGSFNNAWAIFKALWQLHIRIFFYSKKKKQTDLIVKNNRIAEPRPNGIYRFSIVFNYFVKKKKYYREMTASKN